MQTSTRTNLDTKTAATFGAFWLSFHRSPGSMGATGLYDTGAAEPVEACGAHLTATWEDVISATAALGFLNGYAQAARLANEYQSPQWQICNLIAIAAGIQMTLLGGDDPTGRNRQAEKLCATWTAELTALVERAR